MKYDLSAATVKLYTHDPNNPNSLGNHYIRSLLIDSNGVLWIGLDGYGFQVWDAETEAFVRALQKVNFEPDQIEKVYEIYEDDRMNLWFGAYGHGLFVLNNHSSNFQHYIRSYTVEKSLSNNSVLAISEDNEGKIWLGTDGGGLNIFDPESESFDVLKHDEQNPSSISGDVVKALCMDNSGNLWIGTFNYGLNVRWAGKKGFTHFTQSSSGLTSNNVWALLEDSKSNLWIGTLGGGLHVYDSKTGRIEKYLIDFDRDSTLTGVNISTLMEDDEGRLWVGTVGHGINVIDPETGTTKRFESEMDNPTSLSHNEIRGLFQSSKGEIWVGTTYGLNRYNKADDTFTQYYELDGLPSDVIKGIVEDKQGQFWISTNNGVCKFNPQTRKATHFGKSDGVQGNEFNYNASILAQSGKIYMGGINGFNQFDPSLVQDNMNHPEILFTNFSLFNRPVLIGGNGPLTKEINQMDEMEFEYDEYIFTIEFTANEYQFPKKNKYQYKLEGFDPDWNYVGTTRAATYTNLPSGKYSFLVRSTNNAGVWSDQIRQLSIIVRPPWWQTQVAFVIFGVLAVLALLAIVRLRTSYLIAQKVKLRKLVARRTKELEEKNERITMQAEELNTFNDTLNAVNENLEKTVQARTQELLIKKNKLSDYAFLNAHNLRAPVANIKGLVQLFEFDLTMEEKEDIIEKLKKQVDDVDAVLFDINQRLKEDRLSSPETGCAETN